MFGIKKDKRFARIKNYEMDLIEPYRMSEEEIHKFQTSMREVMLYLKYAENRKRLVQLAEQQEFRNVDPVAVSLINEVTGSLIEIPDGEEEIEMGKQMCKAWQEISDEAREKGYSEGHKNGYNVGHESGYSAGHEEGIAEGRAEGRAEEKRKIALNMLSYGMSVADISRVTDSPANTVLEWVHSAR